MFFFWRTKCEASFHLLFSEGSNMGAEETNFDRGYIKKKLEHGLTRIWQVWFFLTIFSPYENSRNLHVKIVSKIQCLGFLYLFFLADLVICYFLWNKSVI